MSSAEYNCVNSLSEPLPVTNLTASPVGTTEMRLSWFYQRNNKSLYLYNVSVNGERWIQSSINTTQVSDLIPGNNYTFTVQAVVNGMISETVAISAFTGITIHTLLKHISFYTTHHKAVLDLVKQLDVSRDVFIPHISTGHCLYE